MKRLLVILLLLGSVVALNSCNDSDTNNKTTSKDSAMNIKEDKVDYKLDTANMHSFVTYDANKQGKRPAVLIVHEWWGINDYIKGRAKQLAELGYIAMSVDMYGDHKIGTNPQEANALATPFYTDPQLTMSRFMAAYNKL